jgi:hypothetical protein
MAVPLSSWEEENKMAYTHDITQIAGYSKSNRIAMGEIKHGREAPLASRLALSIKAMIANCSKVKKNNQGMPKMVWTRSSDGPVKLNTGVAVNLDSRRETWVLW